MAEHAPESLMRLARRDTWFRLLFVLLFVLILMVAQIVLAVVVVIQFGFVLITGERDGKLLAFGGRLNRYIHQILRFMAFNMPDKPFPFAEWPDGDEGEI